MNTPNLEHLKEELQGEERELLDRLLQNGELVHEAFATVDHWGRGKLERSSQHLISQIFEYLCYVHLSRLYHCLTPGETFDVFKQIYRSTNLSKSQITRPDGLSWEDGDGTLWFNEYKTKYRNFPQNNQPDKYNDLFRFLSVGRARYMLEQAIHEKGYRGEYTPGLRLVIPKRDEGEFNPERRFEHPFQIDTCPINMKSVGTVSQAFVEDYPHYFGLGASRT